MAKCESCNTENGRRKPFVRGAIRLMTCAYCYDKLSYNDYESLANAIMGKTEKDKKDEKSS
jgi:hypothetical protein